jgi:putative Ca2+/H+ antiporter (TMEM165/GDT1 family)
VHLTVVATVFPLVFLAELPDKTMFASLLLASRGRPLAVWAGAALAFVAHVVIAVSAGVAVFHLLPHRVVDGIVAAMFLAGAAYAWLSRGEEVAPRGGSGGSTPAVAAGAAGVIFVAEWGDLTQILIANLAARYHDPLAVGVGSLAALLVVTAIAVLGGSRLVGALPVRYVRLATAVVLLALAGFTAARAV